MSIAKLDLLGCLDLSSISSSSSSIRSSSSIINADKWEKLADCPVVGFSKPLILSNDELLLIPYAKPARTNSLYRYNIPSNTWAKLFDYPNTMISNYHTASFNDNKTLIYIFNESGHIIEINVKSKPFEFKESCKQYHDGCHSRSLFISGQFHVFGGWFEDGRKHFVWNKNKQSLDIIHEFDKHKELKDVSSLSHHFIHYIASTHDVLIIPGRKYTTSIYLYSLKTHKCTELLVKLPVAIYSVCAVATHDDRYVVIFDDKLYVIYILDLKLMTVRTGNIGCPVHSYFEPVIVCDNTHNELLTFGYIRNSWKSIQFDNMKPLPWDLIKMISEWYIGEEIIHLFQDGSGSQYRISLSDLLA